MTRHRLAARRGISIIEVTASLVVASMLIFGLLRLLDASGAVTDAALGRSAAMRDATFAAQRLAGDVASATGCGISGPVAARTATQLSLWVDANGDDNAEYVTWRINAGALQRSEVLAPGCVADLGGASWTTVASGLAAVALDDWAFAAVTDGATVTDACSTAAACTADALRYRFTVTVDGAPRSVERVVALNRR